jgi:hypothetical protein
MSDLDRLLDAYSPPAPPEGLAGRAAASAIAVPQLGRGATWPRGERRGRWKRPAWLGAAAVGLAFTSAVAAEVVSGGRIAIPVVHQVVAAIPVLQPPRSAERPVHAVSVKRPAPAPVVHPEPTSPPQPAPTPRERAVTHFAKMKERVEQRRAAGLPTPNADRLEQQAQRIIERREAAGLPAPSLDEVELRLAVREWHRARILRQVARDPSALTDRQVLRFARILPPQKRERFLALAPDQQRQLMARAAQRFLARRTLRDAQAASAETGDDVAEQR